MGLSVRVMMHPELCTSYNDNAYKIYTIDPAWNYKIKNFKAGEYYIGEIYLSDISCGYSSHNKFRELLVKHTGRTDKLNFRDEIIFEMLDDTVPFYDFIDFADNEGCLDYEISEKIYQDFVKHYYVYTELSDYFKQIYKSWMNVFETCRLNKGVVIFC